jgi:hypothetical protein
MGGIANHTFFFVPYYIWVIVALFVMETIAVALWWFFFWWPLTPYHGVFWATIGFRIKSLWSVIPWPHYTGKTGISIVFDENMNMDFITDRSSKVIFAETFKSAQEAENENIQTPSATIGSVLADFVFDPYKWTYPNSPQHKIIEDIAEDWNLQNPTDQVRTLPKFMRYLKEGKFTHESVRLLKTSYLVSWSRIDMMFTDRDEGSTFGWVESLANKIVETANAVYNQFAIPILILFGCVDIMYFIAWIIMRRPPT